MDSLTVSQKLQALAIEKELLQVRWYKSGFTDEDCYTDLGDVEGEMADLGYLGLHLSQMSGGEEEIG